MTKYILAFLALLLFFNCGTDNGKINYLDNFSVFIDEIEMQINSVEEINWTAKDDSLKIFENRKAKFILSTQEEQNIDNLRQRYLELKRANSDEEMVVNFYFENSLSMKGYLEGKKFKQVMHRIYGNLNNFKVNSFFVNTKEYSQVNLLDKIDHSDINEGDIGNSDHQFIFSNAIKNAIGNNLSMVITDGIYSVKDGDIDIVSIEIENAFKNALNKNEIETVVLKLSSEFNGTYYSETCKLGKKAIKINQNRPYYLLLFGNSKSIDKALKNIAVIDKLPGFEQQARFFLTKNLKTNYTILTQGEEKHGDFKASKRGADIILEIEDAKKFEKSGFGGTPSRESYLQFGIALDYSSINLPNTYTENIENYWADDQLGYSVISISDVNDMDKSSKTYKEVMRINEKNKTNFTHILTVKADKNLYGKLHIQLKSNLPTWIETTGTDDDCNIKNDVTHTFAFDQLMIGVSNAYDNNHYLDINLKIRP